MQLRKQSQSQTPPEAKNLNRQNHSVATYASTRAELRDKLKTRTTTPRGLCHQWDLGETPPPTKGQPILPGGELPYAHPGLLRNPEFVHTALQISGEKADWDSERL